MSKNKQQELKQLKPRTEKQAEYIRAIAENDITFCIGVAGTGKTAVSVGLAAQYLLSGKVQKIIITRPTVESGKGIGFLPGRLREKMDPYIVPVLDELYQYLGKQQTEQYLRDGVIEILPLGFMRGRTLKHAFIILDEAQNTTFDEMKMFITRIGEGSKMVINGDIEQDDLKTGQSALNAYYDGVSDRFVGKIEFSESEVVRHPIIVRLLPQIREIERNKNVGGR